MQESIKEFLSRFERIKAAGFIKTHRKGNTGIGKTFEDVCGIVENNIGEPDFRGIEIKSRRNYASSYITLFTKSPSFPAGINSTLRERYGSPDRKYPDMKVLHTSIFGNDYNTHVSGYGYKIETNDEQQRIDLKIKNLATMQLEALDVFWTYQDISDIISQKLNMVAIVEAETRVSDGEEEFHFTQCTILAGLTLERFLQLIDDGTIMFDIRIGVYKTGQNRGRTHDHGSGFRIARRDILRAFDLVHGEI